MKAVRHPETGRILASTGRDDAAYALVRPHDLEEVKAKKDALNPRRVSYKSLRDRYQRIIDAGGFEVKFSKSEKPLRREMRDGDFLVPVEDTTPAAPSGDPDSLAKALSAQEDHLVSEAQAAYPDSDPDKVEADTRSAFRAYVQKLAAKIGKPVREARLEGDAGSRSTLHVTCADGTTQTWDTRTVVNRSSKGKVFLQHRARRLTHAPSAAPHVRG